MATGGSYSTICLRVRIIMTSGVDYKEVVEGVAHYNLYMDYQWTCFALKLNPNGLTEVRLEASPCSYCAQTDEFTINCP